MTNLAGWQATLQSDTGDVISGGSVEVRSTATGTPLASIFDDKEGNTALSNPFNVGTDGFAQFFVATGQYTIAATFGGGTITWTEDLVAAADVAAIETDIDALQDADASAATRVFANAAEVAADTGLTYTAGQNGTVTAGVTFSTTSEAFAYEVAASGAADHHLTTAGGVKLYALPDEKGDVYTSQLGFAANANITSGLATFVAGRQTGIKGIRQDATYEIAGPIVPPSNIKSWKGDNYEQLGHGRYATRTLLWLNGIAERATANGLSQSDLFAPEHDGFGLGGIRITYDETVDPSTFTNSGNASSAYIAQTIVGPWMEKCSTQFFSGNAFRVRDSPLWRMIDCDLQDHNFGLLLEGASDAGLMLRATGEVGYITPTQQFGEFIKTIVAGSRHPQKCIIQDCECYAQRNFVDTTGNCHGWIITGNTALGGFDFKYFSSLLGSLDPEFGGANVSNNTIYGIVGITSQVDVQNQGGLPFSYDRTPRGFTISGNVFIPLPGFTNTTRAISLSGACSDIVATGNVITEYVDRVRATFDASVETEFPSGAAFFDAYEITGNGTIDGLTLTTGEYLYAMRPRSSTTNARHWKTATTLRRGLGLLTAVGGAFFGTSSQGTYDASGGAFPGGSGAVSIGDVWEVTTEGIIDNVFVHVGDKLMANVDIADASVSSFADGDWIRYRAGGPGPRGIIIDGHSGRNLTVVLDDSVSDVTVNLPYCVTDIVERPLDLAGQNITINGGFRTSSGTGATVARINGIGPFYLNLNIRAQDGDAWNGTPIDINGVQTELYLDGYIENLRRIGSVDGTVGHYFLGTRGGLRLLNVNPNSFVTGTAEKVTVGDFTDLDAGTASEAYLTLLGVGLEQTISGGEITIYRNYHLVDTESDAATDDLDTINGGAVGDVLTISAADGARTVVAKDGTGNLTLGADRSLDEAGDTLVLRKYADGNWHEIDFFSVT